MIYWLCYLFGLICIWSLIESLYIDFIFTDEICLKYPRLTYFVLFGLTLFYPVFIIIALFIVLYKCIFKKVNNDN